MGSADAPRREPGALAHPPPPPEVLAGAGQDIGERGSRDPGQPVSHQSVPALSVQQRNPMYSLVAFPSWIQYDTCAPHAVCSTVR